MAEEKIAIFGGSFNPPGIHHQQLVQRLAEEFDRVIVVPCGIRKDKSTTAQVSLADRRKMVELAFSNMEKVEIDFFDLDNEIYTVTFDLQKRIEAKYPQATVYQAVGSDLIVGGEQGNSQIQKSWFRGQELWEDCDFVVMTRQGSAFDWNDLPPGNYLMDNCDFPGSSTEIRDRIKNGQDFSQLVCPEVEKYIKDKNLYR